MPTQTTAADAYRFARRENPPDVAERLTRHVLVHGGLCEPYAAEVAHAARLACELIDAGCSHRPRREEGA